MEDATETLFCTDCGARLRAWDFFRGRAIFLGNLPFCDPCRPPQPALRGVRFLPCNRHLTEFPESPSRT